MVGRRRPARSAHSLSRRAPRRPSRNGRPRRSSQPVTCAVLRGKPRGHGSARGGLLSDTCPGRRRRKSSRITPSSTDTSTTFCHMAAVSDMRMDRANWNFMATFDEVTLRARIHRDTRHVQRGTGRQQRASSICKVLSASIKTIIVEEDMHGGLCQLEEMCRPASLIHPRQRHLLFRTKIWQRCEHSTRGQAFPAEFQKKK